MVIVVDIEANSQNGHYGPISVFGCALTRKNVSSQVIFWISSIASIVSGIFKLYRTFDPNFSRFSEQEMHSLSMYANIYSQLYSISFGLIILSFAYNRSLYIKYLNAYQAIMSNNFGRVATKFMTQRIKMYNFFLIISTMYEILTTLVNIYLFDSPRHKFSINVSINVILVLIAQQGYIFFIQFIIECCIYSQSSFIPINNLLDSLLYRRIQSSADNINRITKSIRIFHIKIAESIRNIDKYLTFFVFVFYLYFTGHCILIIGDILNKDCSFYCTLWMIFRFFGESTYLVIITYHLVRVNRNSVHIFDKVYQVSFSLDSSHSIETMNEINLFLLRTNRNDIGFTFAGLCMVSPSFVSSLATISLTVGLALPSFIK